MLILLVVLWLLGVLARDDPQKDSKYVIKRIGSCPAVGYYFQREASPNALDASVCYLCFCQEDDTAICWRRENKRCDSAHYQHGVGKRDTRFRRSPVGLSDIFFRDAARDLFNKQMPETCKPYESSFSEGCPPADWCTGCTVCDCDANGRWDCHILSFCPDKKDKNKMKKSKKRLRNGPPKRTTTNMNTGVTPTLTTNKNHPKRTSVLKNTTVKTSRQIKLNSRNISKVKQPNKKLKQMKKMKPKTNNTQIRKHTSPKPLIIRKDAKSKKPMVVKSPKFKQLNPNDTDKITQEVFKKVVSAMQIFLEKRISAIQPKPTDQSVQKRSMVKRSTSNITNTKNAKKKVNGKFKPVVNRAKFKSNNKPKNAKKAVQVVKKGVTTNKQSKIPKSAGQRTKRDITQHNITETLVIENSSFVNTVPTTPTVRENEALTNGSGNNNYYKYSFITPTVSITTDNAEEYQIVYALTKNYTKNNDNVSHTHEKRDKQKHFDEIKTNLLNSSATNLKNYKTLQNQSSVAESLPDFNDLKFSNWPQVKLLKNSLFIKKIVHVNATKNDNFVFTQAKVKEDEPVKNNTKSKDVARVLNLPSRKYNRSKIINTLSCNVNNSPKQNYRSFGEQIYHKIDDLQNMVKQVLGEFQKNNTTKIKQKPKRLNVIKYLKKYFSKLFRRFKHKGKLNNKEQVELNSHIIDSICEGFSNCDMNQRNSVILKTKIHELNRESYTIIKTIKIIKGLLHLLDLPGESSDNHNLKLGKGKFNLKHDIRKLNAVLRDKYFYNNTQLTSTQMIQIKYIKNNTQTFVQTVSKFANILNEIISILTNKHNIEDKSKQSFETVKRSYENTRNLKNDTNYGFERLKKLLIKYNLIQNTFIRKMYKLLSKFEKGQGNNTHAKVDGENKVATLEHFSRNIIENLRKLKNLANLLNSRRKRDTVRDDDAMEYLLTLMEYMLKQNYPLDAAPVNDGIDLLIEAIKSAPDIKPIKKKVLQSMPVNIRISRTTEPVPFSMLREDNSIDSRTVNEDVTFNDTISETKEQNSYQDIEKEDDFKYQPGKNIFQAEAVSNTKVEYDKAEPITISNQIDTNVIPGAFGIFGNVEETTEHNNFKKFEQIAKEDSKKFELFNSDSDDEDVEVASTTITADSTDMTTMSDRIVTVTVPLETTAYTAADIKTKEYNINSADISGTSDGDKRVGLDWLDEGYEDSKEVRQTKNKLVTRTEVPVITTIKPIHVDNVSTLTKEIRDEEEKKRKSKINIEDVMFKKQMDLLNSLDYGTERSENDDQDSKEGDERYSGEAFPAYFV